jgi:hypothetical protein
VSGTEMNIFFATHLRGSRPLLTKTVLPPK